MVFNNDLSRMLSLIGVWVIACISAIGLFVTHVLPTTLTLLFQCEWLTVQGLLFELLCLIVFWVVAMRLIFITESVWFAECDFVSRLEEHNIVPGQDATRMLYYEVFTAIHHLTGSAFMLYGMTYANVDVFRHGMLIELAYETFDLTRLWYNYMIVHDKDTAGVLVALVTAHHLPGISLIIPICLSPALSSDRTIQLVASNLLCGGALMMLIAVLNKATNLHTTAGRLQVMATVFFIIVMLSYTRFMIVTPAVYTMIKQRWPSVLSYTLTAGLFLMSNFNILVIVLLLVKVVKLLRTPADGQVKQAVALIRMQSSQSVLVNAYMALEADRPPLERSTSFQQPSRRGRRAATKLARAATTGVNKSALMWQASRPRGLLFDLGAGSESDE